MKSISDYILTNFFMWNKFDKKKNFRVTKEIIKGNEKKAILFFPYWTGKSSMYNRLLKKFPNYTLVLYDYPNEVLSEDVNVSINYLNKILNDALSTIKELKKQGYREITLIGSSLGSNIAIKLANLIEVDKVILNMIDRTFAREIFKSPALAILKNKLKKQGFTLAKLENIYSFISTENSINKIKNKSKVKFLIFASRSDIFCQLEELNPVLAKFKKNHIHYQLKTNYLFGHILSIYKNLIFNKPIVNFIKNN